MTTKKLKTKVIGLRVTLAEEAKLKQKAGELTLTAYVRRRLGLPVRPRKPRSPREPEDVSDDG